MGIRWVNVVRRASVNDEFYLTVPHRVAGLTEHVVTNYRNTGLITKNSYSDSPDRLTRVTVIEFADQAAYDQYHADPVIQSYKQHRSSWFAANPACVNVAEITESTNQACNVVQYFLHGLV